jgi:uncharacterized repeat protein (TIGR03943 family)
MSVAAGRSRIVVTAVWAAFFYVLWLTHGSARFLGTRTQWLVPFGAITLTVAAALALRSQRRTRTPLSLAEAIGLFTLVVPLALLLLAPHAQLGAYAASRKATSFFPAVKPPPPATPRDVTLLDIRVAEDDNVFALTSHIHSGTRVGLLGLVTGVGTGRFSLTRFYITCCIADAQPVTIQVEWPRPVTRNHWVWVTGVLRAPSSRFTLAADAVTPRPSPSDPYLSFSSY